MAGIESISEDKINLLQGKVSLGKPLSKEEADKAFDWMREQLERNMKEEGYKYSKPQIDNIVYRS